jgi:hypothetical protein|tara:strand:- start:798 stop:1142 length:345 start_codon:yes stop_codon:yes gene_type:complete
MNKNILISIALFFVGQLLVWFQLYGQFLWKWFDKNPLLLSLTGIPISYIFIVATKYGYVGFDDLLWPQRLIAFGVGILSFAFCTYYLLGEGINAKTLVSLTLAVTLVLIQVFWK